MKGVYPFASGSEYTASFAISASYALSASAIDYVATASAAGTILNPISGSAASVNICIITYQQYLAMLANPSLREVCVFPPG
jgi:hypothetical protein